MTTKRIWHGWTTPENADAYQALLRTEILAGIEAKGMPGYRGIEVLRRDDGDDVEFITIMTFDSVDSVRQFQGEDYERSYVPAAARSILKRWDERARHYDLIDDRRYD